MFQRSTGVAFFQFFWVLFDNSCILKMQQFIAPCGEAFVVVNERRLFVLILYNLKIFNSNLEGLKGKEAFDNTPKEDEDGHFSNQLCKLEKRKSFSLFDVCISKV